MDKMDIKLISKTETSRILGVTLACLDVYAERGILRPAKIISCTNTMVHYDKDEVIALQGRIMSDHSRYITIYEAAIQLGVSVYILKQFKKQGKLTFYKSTWEVRPCTLLDKREVDELEAKMFERVGEQGGKYLCGGGLNEKDLCKSIS